MSSLFIYVTLEVTKTSLDYNIILLKAIHVTNRNYS